MINKKKTLFKYIYWNSIYDTTYEKLIKIFQKKKFKIYKNIKHRDS